MQSIANIFLILYLNAAGIGLVDAIFGKKFALPWLAPLHDFAAGMTVFFALVIYFGFAFNKHLPTVVCP